MAKIIENKLLFIHIAKTGGTFIKEVLSVNGFKHYESGDELVHDHISYNDVIKVNPELTKLIPFAIIRKPHEWILSRHSWAMKTEFNYKIKAQPTAQKHWMAKVWDDDPIKFVENTVNECPNIPTIYFNNMANILFENNVNIFLTEKMDDCLNFIEEHTGKKILERNVLNAKNTNSKIVIPNKLLEKIYNNNSIIYNKYYNGIV